MALYALDEENIIIFAPNAINFKRYRCLECQGPVKKRSGRYRRAHFCHIRNSPQCRLHSKSIDHLILQNDLKKKIPQLELEKPFPSILRIADLCWEEQKLIFEIQCSPISAAEVAKRKRDYSQVGYDLIWLLDDRLFNKKRLRIAEEEIRKDTSYFLSLKHFRIYDQFEFINDGARLEKGPALPVDLAEPRRKELKQIEIELSQLKEKKTDRYFLGDLIDRVSQNSIFLKNLIEREKSLKVPLRKSRFLWIKMIFLIGFEYLLRKSAREDF